MPDQPSKESLAISALLNENPSMTRDYATGYVKGQASITPPHMVAEQIATAITPTKGIKARRDALNWAAQVCRSMFPKPEKTGGDAGDGSEATNGGTKK